MIRIAHLSDLHLCERVRYDGTLRVLEAFVSGIQSRPIDLVLIGGDMGDPRRAPAKASPAERNAIVSAVVRLASVAPIVLVRGNHDAIGDWDFLEMLKVVYSIRVISEPASFMVGNSGALLTIHAIPWLGPRWHAENDIDQLFDRIRADIAERPEYVHVGIAHMSVSGARLASGQQLVGGEVQIPAQALADLGLDYMALGHYHSPQKVAPSCWYAGSPNRLNFGETGDPCCWLYVEIDDDGTRVQQVELPADVLVTIDAKVIEFDGQIALDVCPFDDLGYDPDPTDIIDGASVRLRVMIPEGLSAEDAVAQTVAGLETRGAADVTVERIPVAALRAREGAEEIAAAPNLRDKVSAWMGQRNLSDEQSGRVLTRFDTIEETGT